MAIRIEKSRVLVVEGRDEVSQSIFHWEKRLRCAIIIPGDLILV